MTVNGDINKATDILLGIPTTERWSNFEDSALTMDQNSPEFLALL
jgi:hypothetical protein